MDQKYVISTLRSLCSSVPELLEIRELSRNYMELEGSEIPLFGHNSLESLLESLKDDFKLIRNVYEIKVRAIPKSSSIHILELISKQKPRQNKPKRRFGFRPRRNLAFPKNQKFARDFNRKFQSRVNPVERVSRGNSIRRNDSHRRHRSPIDVRRSSRLRQKLPEQNPAVIQKQPCSLPAHELPKKRKSDDFVVPEIPENKILRKSPESQTLPKENLDSYIKSPINNEELQPWNSQKEENVTDPEDFEYVDWDAPENQKNLIPKIEEPTDFEKELKGFMIDLKKTKEEEKISATVRKVFFWHEPEPIFKEPQPQKKVKRDPRLKNSELPPFPAPSQSAPQPDPFPQQFPDPFCHLPNPFSHQFPNPGQFANQRYQDSFRMWNIRYEQISYAPKPEPPEMEKFQPNNRRPMLEVRPALKLPIIQEKKATLIPEICVDLDTEGAQIKKCTITFEKIILEFTKMKKACITGMSKLNFKIPKKK